MKKKNMILFITILIMGLIWGFVYWFLIAPVIDLG